MLHFWHRVFLFSLFCSCFANFTDFSRQFIFWQSYALPAGPRYNWAVRSTYCRTYIRSWLLFQPLLTTRSASGWARFNLGVRSTEEWILAARCTFFLKPHVWFFNVALVLLCTFHFCLAHCMNVPCSLFFFQRMTFCSAKHFSEALPFWSCIEFKAEP